MGNLVCKYFAGGTTERTLKSYSSSQRRYINFCNLYHLSPLPLSECTVCLFAAYLAHQGLQPNSISAYLSALRHLQVSAGLPPPPREDWPRLQYVLKGITRSQPLNRRNRLPITSELMLQLQAVWARWTSQEYRARMLWAACCLAYFGFMRSGEFTLSTSTARPPILSSDFSVDSHSNPSVCRLFSTSIQNRPGRQGCFHIPRENGLSTMSCHSIDQLHGSSAWPSRSSICASRWFSANERRLCQCG